MTAPSARRWRLAVQAILGVAAAFLIIGLVIGWAS